MTANLCSRVGRPGRSFLSVLLRMWAKHEDLMEIDNWFNWAEASGFYFSFFFFSKSQFVVEEKSPEKSSGHLLKTRPNLIEKFTFF